MILIFVSLKSYTKYYRLTTEIKRDKCFRFHIHQVNKKISLARSHICTSKSEEKTWVTVNKKQTCKRWPGKWATPNKSWTQVQSQNNNKQTAQPHWWCCLLTDLFLFWWANDAISQKRIITIEIERENIGEIR